MNTKDRIKAREILPRAVRKVRQVASLLYDRWGPDRYAVVDPQEEAEKDEIARTSTRDNLFGSFRQ